MDDKKRMLKYLEYFDFDGFIIGDLSGKRRVNSMGDKDDNVYEVLTLEDDCHRLAIGKEHDCSCRPLLLSNEKILRLRDQLNILDKMKFKTVRMEVDVEIAARKRPFDFNRDEFNRLRNLLNETFPLNEYPPITIGGVINPTWVM